MIRRLKALTPKTIRTNQQDITRLTGAVLVGALLENVAWDPGPYTHELIVWAVGMVAARLIPDLVDYRRRGANGGIGS